MDGGSAPAPPLGHLSEYTVLAAHTALAEYTVPGGGQFRHNVVNLANEVHCTLYPKKAPVMTSKRLKPLKLLANSLGKLLALPTTCTTPCASR